MCDFFSLHQVWLFLIVFFLHIILESDGSKKCLPSFILSTSKAKKAMLSKEILVSAVMFNLNFDVSFEHFNTILTEIQPVKVKIAFKLKLAKKCKK